MLKNNNVFLQKQTHYGLNYLDLANICSVNFDVYALFVCVKVAHVFILYSFSFLYVIMWI